LVGTSRLTCGAYLLNPRKYENYINGVQELDEDERNELAHTNGIIFAPSTELSSKWELLFAAIHLSLQDYQFELGTEPLPPASVSSPAPQSESEAKPKECSSSSDLEVVDLSQLFVDREIFVESDPDPGTAQELEHLGVQGTCLPEEEAERGEEEEEKRQDKEGNIEREGKGGDRQEETEEMEEEDLMDMDQQPFDPPFDCPTEADTSLANEGEVESLLLPPPSPVDHPLPPLPTAKRWSLLLHPHRSEDPSVADQTDTATPTEVLFAPHKRLRRLLTGALLHTSTPNS
jgi:hypothetical protein